MAGDSVAARRKVDSAGGPEARRLSGRRGSGSCGPAAAVAAAASEDRRRTTALAWVKAHGTATRFGLIVSSQSGAARYIIDGETVAGMGGFSGREAVVSTSFLSSIVASGEARYFLLDGTQSSTAASDVASACKLVSISLYDCKGDAAKLAAG